MTTATRLPAQRRSTAWLSAARMAGMIARREAGAEEIAREVLADVEAVDPALNCFAALDPELVLAAAARIDRAAGDGPAGTLRAIPVPVKDLIATRDYPTAFGSKPFAENRPQADAPAVGRMLGAGGILLGKTTTSEFGCKATGYSPLTGHTRNPWNTKLTPGGSSAGSAAAVAAGLTPVALGTDGGGSVRIPAALTGLFGFKATFGRIPVYPVSATPTLGHVGVLARTVRDAALVADAISGYDARDPFALPLPPLAGLAACDRPLGAPRVAYSPTLGYARPQAGVLAAVEDGVRALEALGCRVTVIDSVFADPVDIWESEFYGDVAAKLADLPAAERAELDADVARKLDRHAGRSLLAHRRLAQQRFGLRETVRALFADFDLLVTPTLPAVAFDCERTAPPGYDRDDLVGWASYTYPFNLTGHPAVSLPVGMSDGLPVGLQIVAGLFEEERLLTISAAFEQARPWPDRIS